MSNEIAEPLQRNKGGRPRKPSDEKKGIRIQVAATEEQLRMALALAKRYDTSLSGIITEYCIPMAYAVTEMTNFKHNGGKP